MDSIRSNVVVEELKRQFGVHGIPAEVISDNGPQDSSHEFQEFVKVYDIKHTTSSPHFPKPNGGAEEPSKPLRICGERTKTSIWLCELFPVQLLMGRRLRNELPMMESLLQPATNNQQPTTYFQVSSED